jgi:hypothetical protein
MRIISARSSIESVAAIAAAILISATVSAFAQQNAVRMEEPGTGEGITWWVVGAGGVLGSGSEQGELLSATVGQTAIDKVEYRSSDGRLYPAMTTWLGYWLPEAGSSGTSDVAGTDSLPGNAKMATNHPNPFTTETVISYSLPRSGHVRLRIYDMKGMQVRQLVDGAEEAGTHQVAWDAHDDAGGVLSSGTYIYTLEQIDPAPESDGSRATARGMLYLVK